MKFDSQAIETSNNPSCRTNEAPWNETNEVGMHDLQNKQNYCKIISDRQKSKVLTNKIQNEFSSILSGIGCFEGTFTLQVKDGS